MKRSGIVFNIRCLLDRPPARAMTVVFSLRLIALAAKPAYAQSVEAFYKSHPITMLVGSGAGGGYDVYARTFARFWSNHIPGHPDIIAKDMPAAAGLAAASTLYTNAARDGSVIGAFTNGAAMDPLFGNPGAHFDALKFNWLGSIGKLENVCATWHTSPVKTIAQARERQVIVAAAGATSNTAIVPNMLNTLIGTKFKVISGYDPGSGLTLAVESGEAEGICGLSWSTMKASRPRWISEHLLNVIVQMGLTKARGTARCAERARSGERSAEQAGDGADPDAPGGRPAVRGAAGYAARPRRGVAPGVRCNAGRSGLRRRGAARPGLRSIR